MCAMYAFMRKADDLADDESINVDERQANDAGVARVMAGIGQGS